MRMLRLLTCLLFGAVMAAGCGSSPSNDNTAPITDNPYDTCYSGDSCAGGLTCIGTNLPASSGYTGYFCTSVCSFDTDCLQIPTNYTASCVNGLCYLTCPAGSSTCPYDQSCFTFDSNLGSIDLCTP
ncbi:MAG: hypothetical protein WBV96_25125 [Polyangia bacterium]|jgi:hypothetical protein